MSEPRYLIRNRYIVIFKDSTRTISDGPIWVCFQSHYMYSAASLPKLLWITLTQWRADRHLVG